MIWSIFLVDITHQTSEDSSTQINLSNETQIWVKFKLLPSTMTSYCFHIDLLLQLSAFNFLIKLLLPEPNSALLKCPIDPNSESEQTFWIISMAKFENFSIFTEHFHIVLNHHEPKLSLRNFQVSLATVY